MKQWWQQLQQRERILVIAMAAVIGVFILYQGIWSPINNGLTKADQKLERTEQLLSYVQQTTSQLKNTQGVKRTSSGSLSSVVNRVARQHNITIDRVQPNGDDLQVWIDEVAFNQLLRMLTQLSEQHGLSVSNIDISKGNNEGIVKVRRLQVSRG
ncbi:type II secretion system protein GspM [Thalassotalea euphylliae]|uniref:type II secretion system protein GspM n=1 Tax=Thalassotalea euphylliae TaxID=1655234 RepID=UPI0036391B9C